MTFSFTDIQFLIPSVVKFFLCFYFQEIFKLAYVYCHSKNALWRNSRIFSNRFHRAKTRRVHKILVIIDHRQLMIQSIVLQLTYPLIKRFTISFLSHQPGRVLSQNTCSYQSLLLQSF